MLEKTPESSLDSKEIKPVNPKGKVKLLSRGQLFVTPWTVAHQVPHPWDSPGKNTGVGCHFLLQELFLTQGSNSGLPHCRQTLYHLSHQGSPRILEWVAYTFSRDLPDPGIKPGSPALRVDS